MLRVPYSFAACFVSGSRKNMWCIGVFWYVSEMCVLGSWSRALGRLVRLCKELLARGCSMPLGWIPRSPAAQLEQMNAFEVGALVPPPPAEQKSYRAEGP